MSVSRRYFLNDHQTPTANLREGLKTLAYIEFVFFGRWGRFAKHP